MSKQSRTVKHFVGILSLLTAAPLLLAANGPVSAANQRAIVATCPGSVLSQLQVGMAGQVSITPAGQKSLPVNVHASATVSSTVLFTIKDGTPFTVIAGFKCADNLTWWQIKTASGSGWTAEGDSSGYFIIPAGANAAPTGSGAASSPTVPADLNGAWSTNIAALTISQTRTRVVAAFKGYGGHWNFTATGVMNGQTVTLKDTKNILGSVSIQLSDDGSSFKSTDPNFAFCGVRSGPLPPGCGFSGKWDLSLTSSLLPTGGYAILVQTGPKVTGTIYDNSDTVVDNITGDVNWQKGWWLSGKGDSDFPPFTWYMDGNERGFQSYNDPTGNGTRDSLTAADAPVFIKGQVVDSAGDPITGIDVAVSQGASRVDAHSGADGRFMASLPTNSAGQWDVQLVGIDCTSNVMDSNCHMSGYFQVNVDQTVFLPQTQDVVLTFEKATAAISGRVVNAKGQGVNGRVYAVRDDGASSWTDSTQTGEFSLPAGPGLWDVYALTFNPSREGKHVQIMVGPDTTTAPITVVSP